MTGASDGFGRYLSEHVLPVAMTLLPRRMDSPPARRLLMAIAYQEAEYRARRQVAGWRAGQVLHGPARGPWQFERIGVAGVAKHPATAELYEMVCARLLYPDTRPAVIHKAIEHNDVLAAAVARLLLWTDPHALPTDRAGGWAAYLRTWRPGKPKPDKWAESWDMACHYVPFSAP